MSDRSNQSNRRAFLSLMAGGAAAALALPAATRAQGAKRPNVLILQPDQHRGTIMGCMGDKQAHTPNLDRLAAGGIRFSHCASASPVCSPYRGTVQTGLYPHKHGVVQNNILLDTKLRCFAEVFVEAGYATGYIGKWHLDGGLPKKEGGEGVTTKAVGGWVPPERRRGWQEWNGYEKAHEYFEVWRYNADAKKERVTGYDWEPTWQTDVALDFIKRHSAANKPWLYYLAYGPPHNPEQCPEEFLKLFDPAKIVFPPDIAGRVPEKEEAALRELYQIYYGQVAAVDREVGRLLDGLKALGVDGNTIILYTSDHGDYLGSHWGGQVGKLPKESTPGQTAAQAAKAGAAAAKKGKKPQAGATSGDEGGDEASAFGKLRGKACPYSTAFRIPMLLSWPDKIKAGQVCDAVASSVDLTPTILDLAGLPPIKGMQGDSMAGWCLKGDGVRNEGVWIGLSRWRAAWDGRYVYSPLGYHHLYDLQTDPYEMKNLIDAPDHQEVRQRMHALLIKLAERAEDPLLDQLKAIKA